MELSPNQRKTVRHQFDSFCKKVLREEYRDYLRQMQRRMRHEVTFSDLSLQDKDELCTMDEYPADSHYFNVAGYDIPVKDELLSKALSALPERKRAIILLSYFLDMTDQEISGALNLVRRTVQYHRMNTLKQLKEMLEGKADEET